MEPKYTEGSNGGSHSDRHSNAQIPRLWREFGPIWILGSLGSLGYQGHYRTIKDTMIP